MVKLKQHLTSLKLSSPPGAGVGLPWFGVVDPCCEVERVMARLAGRAKVEEPLGDESGVFAVEYGAGPRSGVVLEAVTLVRRSGMRSVQVVCRLLRPGGKGVSKGRTSQNRLELPESKAILPKSCTNPHQ